MKTVKDLVIENRNEDGFVLLYGYKVAPYNGCYNEWFGALLHVDRPQEGGPVDIQRMYVIYEPGRQQLAQHFDEVMATGLGGTDTRYDGAWPKPVYKRIKVAPANVQEVSHNIPDTFLQLAWDVFHREYEPLWWVCARTGWTGERPAYPIGYTGIGGIAIAPTGWIVEDDPSGYELYVGNIGRVGMSWSFVEILQDYEHYVELARWGEGRTEYPVFIMCNGEPILEEIGDLQEDEE